MSILVTGAAGFIGYHVSKQLLNRGESVVGLDNLNDYYDVNLKQARLKQLQTHNHFTFIYADITDQPAMTELASKYPDIKQVIHLAAQAGVRYSLTHPYVYTNTNVVGHLTVLEFCKRLPMLTHLIYASSSSVYGANQKLPFSVQDRVETPMSLYAATKLSSELMSYTYSHLYHIPSTGLRFFTAYGPWGRPDMSAFIFTKAILIDEEIPVFNHGNMRRNFTYIDDIVSGILASLDHPPCSTKNSVPHKLYNIGNNRSEHLMDYIKLLENLIGKKAKIRFEDMQPGEVPETIADISDSTQDLGFLPSTRIEDGLKEFVNWYRGFYAV